MALLAERFQLQTHQETRATPAIVLRARSDRYYIVDGRRRVSVALALGCPDIDAWVTGA